jgi:hypothetical protein
MSPRELLSDLRARGVEFRLSEDLQTVLFRGASDADRETIRREKLWLLMLLAHEAGGDCFDPRLAFLDQAENGLTRGAIETRMWIAFDVTRELADALVELALEAGYLRMDGELCFAVGSTAAVLREREALPA